MSNIAHISETSKSPIRIAYLILLIREAVRDKNDAISYSIKLAVKNHEPEINIINMLKDYLNDIGSVCAITELLGVELADKIKSF